MKKLLIIITCMASAFAAAAQQGTWYIGGLGGYSSDTDKGPSAASGVLTITTTNWAFAPEIGTFLQDDIQLGIALRFEGSSVKDDNNEQRSSSTFRPIVYGRKFFKLTDNFSTFAGLYVNYSTGTDTDYLPVPTTDDTSGFGVALGIGVAYALSPRFTAVGQYGVLGYQSEAYKTDGLDAGSTSSFDFGVNTVGGAVFNIGLYYTFVTKTK
jgi:hypothetical protein